MIPYDSFYYQVFVHFLAGWAIADMIIMIVNYAR